jgi:hypothetical protein
MHGLEVQTSGSRGTWGATSQAEDGVYCSYFQGESIFAVAIVVQKR